MSIPTIRTAYSRHVLRCELSGTVPLTLTRFARLVGFVTNLE